MNSDETVTSKALADLQIVSSTVQAADTKTRKRYEDAVKFGNLPCAYTKVILLGDSGVGKTSTRKLLMSEKHSTKDGQSTFGIETHVVDGNFRTVPFDGHSEMQKAAAYFAVYGTSNLLTHIDVPRYIVLLRQLWLVLGIALTCALPILLFCFRGLVLGFAPLLILSVCATTLLLKNAVMGFNIGNGIAVILLAINHVSTVELTANESVQYQIFVCLGYIMGMAVIGYFMGFILGLGTGAGFAAAVVLMVPPKISKQVEIPPTSDAVIYMNSNDLLQALRSMLIVLFVLIVLLVRSKTANKRATLTVKALTVCFAISLVNAAVYFEFSMEWAMFTCIGLAYGYFFVSGQIDGRSTAKIINVGHVNRLFTDFLGWEIGTIYASYIGWWLSWDRLLNDKVHLIQAISGVTLCICFELYRWYVAKHDDFPVTLVRQEIRDNKSGKWPLRYCLLDCAGNELYHVGHHVFMAKHAVYLIVFSLEDAYLRPKWQLERLLYWLNSVFSHARHRDALVFLIGTFKAPLESTQVDNIGYWLYNELYLTFGGRLAMNEKRLYFGRPVPLFAVENRFRMHNVGCPDMDALQQQIMNKVSKAEYSTRPVPLKWFHFYDFIIKCRTKYKNSIDDGKTEKRKQPRDLVYDFHELYYILKPMCGFQEEAEYYRMLQFFADFGEIFFKPNDPRLFRFVILDAKMLMDCIEALAGSFSVQVNPSIIYPIDMAWNKLEKQGIASHDLLSDMLQHIPVDIAVNIKLLTSMELIIPIRKSTEEYIVPFRLPIQHTMTVLDQLSYKSSYFFDFGYFYPEVIFLNLLAKCRVIMYQSTESSDVEVSDRDLHLCKDSGIFYFSDAIVYQLQLRRISVSKNLIEIKVHVNDESNVNPLNLFKQLDTIVNLVRMRDFEYLTYESGMLCHCLGDEFQTHQFHLRVFSRHGTTEDRNFLERNKFLCGGRTTVVELPTERNFIDQVLLEQDLKRYSVSEATGMVFDVFISCCRDDRPWVQCELLSVLENVESPFREIGFFDKPTVAVKINYIDNPNPNLNKLSLLQMNVQDIASCATILVVLSRSYLNDARCRSELSYIASTRTSKTIIPIIKDSCKCPDLFANYKTLDFEYCRKECCLLGRFYLPIIYAIKQKRRIFMNA